MAKGLQTNSELDKGREEEQEEGLQMELAVSSFPDIFSSFPGTAAPQE